MKSFDTRRIALGLAVLPWLAAALLPAAAGAQPGADSVLISLSADGTEVTEILEILAQRSGLNIVTSAEAQGRIISVRLRETPFLEALTLVIRSAGLTFERVGNSILVASPEELHDDTGLVTRVFDLQYADAADVATMLGVICDNVVASESKDRLVVNATLAQVEEAAELIAQLDVMPAQIALEARLIEVNTSALLEIGVDWEQITKFTSVLSEGPARSGPIGRVPTTMDFIPFEGSESIHRQQLAFEIAIEALITDGQARLLSNAKVATLEGEPAEIFAGETVPVVVTSLQSSSGGGGGVFQNIQLEEVDVGVRLRITPRLSDDGLITVLVEPEVSRIVGFVGPDDDLPQTSERRARARVRVADGQKIFLGGLLLDEERSTVKKVPLLGHIPLLGYLFQHTRKETVRNDLVIEITPHILTDANLTQGLAPVR